MSKTFNANKTYEQKRLTELFPKERDVVYCKRPGTATEKPGGCYVKGRLQPSRALGDLSLKHDEFNFHYGQSEHGYRKPFPKENYSGPYINHLPDIIVHDITEEDRFLILASDGLWDELNRKESAEIIQEQLKNLEAGKQIDQKMVCEKLMGTALNHAAKRNGLTRDWMG